MSTGDRIKKLRRELDLTQKEFGERIGIKGNTVAQYELGRSNPIDAVLSLICREFNVREEWLRTGEGEMFRPKPSDILNQLANKYQLSNSDYVIVEKFLSLSPEMRKGLFDFFHEITAALDGLNPSVPAYQRTETSASVRETVADRIEAEVNDYRRELELEARQAEKSSVYDDTADKKNA